MRPSARSTEALSMHSRLAIRCRYVTHWVRVRPNRAPRRRFDGGRALFSLVARSLHAARIGVGATMGRCFQGIVAMRHGKHEAGPGAAPGSGQRPPQRWLRPLSHRRPCGTRGCSRSHGTDWQRADGDRRSAGAVHPHRRALVHGRTIARQKPKCFCFKPRQQPSRSSRITFSDHRLGAPVRSLSLGTPNRQ
jgi:hypothetical protein